MNFYKCNKCGKVLFSKELLECCGASMEMLVPNVVEASLEKHLPSYEIIDSKVKVKIGEIYHPMSEEHYIVFVAKVLGDNVEFHYFNSNDVPECEFLYEKGMGIYSYCNIHGLWMVSLD